MTQNTPRTDVPMTAGDFLRVYSVIELRRLERKYFTLGEMYSDALVERDKARAEAAWLSAERQRVQQLAKTKDDTIAQLRAALEQIAEWCEGSTLAKAGDGQTFNGEAREAFRIARAALAQGGGQ